MALRYFNVAGADPRGRSGQSTPNATHLIKVAAQAALGQRPYVEVFGTDYPTSDGTCVRDYIHVTDLIGAHLAALQYLRKGGNSAVLNCGYGRGFSVLEVIASVKRAAKRDFPVHMGPRRPGDPAALVAKADRIGEVLGWQPRYDDLNTIVGHTPSPGSAKRREHCVARRACGLRGTPPSATVYAVPEFIWGMSDKTCDRSAERCTLG